MVYFGYFEELGLKLEDKIVLIDRRGRRNDGHYKGNYSKSDLAFDFYNLNSGLLKRVLLREIQSLIKVEPDFDERFDKNQKNI